MGLTRRMTMKAIYSLPVFSEDDLFWEKCMPSSTTCAQPNSHRSDKVSEELRKGFRLIVLLIFPEPWGRLVYDESAILLLDQSLFGVRAMTRFGGHLSDMYVCNFAWSPDSVWHQSFLVSPPAERDPTLD